MKKVLSVLCSAAVTVGLFTVSVSAATGYADDPGYTYTNPLDTSKTDTTDNSVKAVDSKVIEDAIKSGEPIVISDETAKLTKDALASIIEADKPVTFKTKDGIALEIDPATITDAAREIDLSMEVSLFDKATQINSDVKVPANSIVIAPAASGEFGFEIKITIPAQVIADAGLKGNNLKLYYIDDDGNITDYGKVKVSDDGSVNVTISHASQYVIAEEAPVNVEDDTDDISDEEEDTDDEEELDDDTADVSFDDANDSEEDEAAEVVINNVSTATGTKGTEKNPATGVTLALTAAGVAGLVAIVSRKTKK